MTTFRTATDIQFTGRTLIQQGATAGNQLSDTVPADTKLVYENGIWKYPQLAAAGAFAVTRPCKLVEVLADLGASTTWTLVLAGHASNTSGEPYAAGDAALYLEPTVQIATGTGRYVALTEHTAALPMLAKGQRVYMTSAAGTAPVCRMAFVPLL